MRDDQIPRIKTRSDAVEKSFDALLKFFGNLADPNGRAFDVSTLIPSTDSSISDLRARAATVAGLIRKFDDKGGALTPIGDFVGFVNASNATSNAMVQIQDAITNNILNADGLQSIEYSNFTFLSKNGGSTTLDSQFKTLFDSFESYLSSFQQIFQSVTPSRAAFNFSSAASALSQTFGRAQQVGDALQGALNVANKELEKVSANQSAFDAIISDIRAKQNLLLEQSGQAAEAISNISSRNDEASNLASSTKQLRDQVNGYRSDFDSFQNQLDNMRSVNQEGGENLRILIQKFDEQAKSFDQLIEQSSQMLSASTVAGLASEFGTIRDGLDTKLNDAHSSFKWAIAFLFASALPLILFVFSPFIVAFMPDNKNLSAAIAGMTANQSGWHYVGQVFARFVILVPAVWYVAFCTARYNSLFKLKEHYSYKYSMAVAVEGFKKQAPGYDEMIAALVFEQLAFNPADKLGKQHEGPESPPNPIAELLLKALRKNSDSEPA